jgi:hypothetical protein
MDLKFGFSGSYGAIYGAARVTPTIPNATTAQNAERGLRFAKVLTPCLARPNIDSSDVARG